MSITLATIDLGSNSFHMLISRLDKHGRKRTVLRQKQQVKLRAGIDREQHLSDKAKQTALACLADFSANLKKHKVDYAKVIGTYTLRTMHDVEFLSQAETALGFPIQVISGEEEARLVYLGASLGININNNHHTLVIDIGGGSTELIVGKGNNIVTLTSLPMGCVGFQQQFFSDGLLTQGNFNAALAEARANLAPIVQTLQGFGWQHCLGSSGTIQTISSLLHALGWHKGYIDKTGLELIVQKLLAVKTVEAIKFVGVREDRESILAGGLCILLGIFEVLNIQEMQLSPGGVREAILHELMASLKGQTAIERQHPDNALHYNPELDLDSRRRENDKERRKSA
ncbi:MAG: Ppx/GppA family phosphatase [Gammaproteobacteria bacterium]|nr:Ppx/GppA family phosphatase [Gammaproteobacteria bacterium]